jgi:DNA-binding NarL/FixJ family response regulator
MDVLEGTHTVLVQGDGAPSPGIGARHGGIPVGDRALAFRSAAGAVRCAVAIEEDAAAPIGLHAGEIGQGEAASARPVTLAARLATLARHGQVLVSALVRELAAEEAGLHFGEARDVSLPGLAGRMTVHEVRWSEHRRPMLRVVIADDAALVRDGVAALMRDHGIDVAATAGNAEELHEAVARHLPDVALVDIRMPPTFTDEGLVAAERIRAGFPDVGVLVLSQHLDARYALRVAEGNPARTGYLLKDRVTDSRILFDALERIAAGGCVIDRAVAEGLVTRASALARIEELTDREREVLALVAEGLANRAIAERLVVTQKTVETHIGQIFLKLGLRDVEGEDRRVAAVLAYLRTAQPSG